MRSGAVALGTDSVEATPSRLVVAIATPAAAAETGAEETAPAAAAPAPAPAGSAGGISTDVTAHGWPNAHGDRSDSADDGGNGHCVPAGNEAEDGDDDDEA